MAVKWNIIEEISPPVGEIVWTKFDNGYVHCYEEKLIFEDNLWWLIDKSNYIKYTPTHWREN